MSHGFYQGLFWKLAYVSCPGSSSSSLFTGYPVLLPFSFKPLLLFFIFMALESFSLHLLLFPSILVSSGDF